MSIRRQLLATLLLALTFIGIAATAATYFSAQRAANELLDEQLRQVALSLRDQTFQLRGGLPGQLGLELLVQVWNDEGTRIYVSHPQPVLPESAGGFTTVSSDGEEWRVFALDDGQRVIQVAQPLSLRGLRAGRLAFRILWPLLAALPLFGLLLWLIVERGMQPLGELARALSRRDPESLEPLPHRKLPEEIRPLVTALNGLLARLRAVMDAQRRFTADAAHELRTPATALQLQLQLVERAQDEPERREAVAQMRAGAQRLRRTIEKLLALARSTSQAEQEALAPVALDALASQVTADFEPIASAKPIELRLAQVQPVSVCGRHEALRSMLANLVENAVRYTPPGGRVTVGVGIEGNEAVLCVCDTGPGIAAAERERVFDRFYRSQPADAEGSGLGLAIVKSVADAHRARVELEDGPEGRGLLVRVRLPLSLQ